VTPHTTVKWQPAPGAAGYRIWWRATTDPQWRYSRLATGDTTQLRLDNLVIDDWFFGVSAISADGYESPVVFPGDAGAFWCGALEVFAPIGEGQRRLRRASNSRCRPEADL
jgi:hypothetical protein